jgi:hypothetical protein
VYTFAALVNTTYTCGGVPSGSLGGLLCMLKCVLGVR